VIKVLRRRNELKTGKRVPSVETSYYLTNEVGNYEELKEAKQEGKSKKVKGKSKNQEISSPEQFFMPEKLLLICLSESIGKWKRIITFAMSRSKKTACVQKKEYQSNNGGS